MAGTTARTRKTTAKTPEAAPTQETAAEAAPAQEAAAEAAPAQETAPAETTTPAPAEETAPAVEDTPTVDSTPKAPEAAPLEPPAVQEAPEAPAEPGYASPTDVIPDEANLSEVIIDDATKEPPADPGSVFRPLTPYGSTLVCTVRLVERTYIGPHSNPIERLLQPAGAHVSESIAARIQERLDAQAERLATHSSDEK
ncbi:hypothetical protein ACFVYV_25500 [Streptomyces mirabilis]|uniref:hypothetical protein n=1 Tax=Streptomyces mirabilis TaxID=68239 RepID=UPI0036DAF783